MSEFLWPRKLGKKANVKTRTITTLVSQHKHLFMASCFSCCELISNKPWICDNWKKTHCVDLYPFDNQGYQKSIIIKLNFDNVMEARHHKVNRETLNFSSVCRKKNGLVCGNMESECHLNLISTQRFSSSETHWFNLLTCVLECLPACRSNQLALSVGEKVLFHCHAIQLSEKVANKGH